MQQKASTKENINSLIEFRQAIYAHGMLARRDALIDLLDALLAEGRVTSFAMLSQSGRFCRKWPSLYSAVEDGRLDSDWLREFLAQQVPGRGVNIFALDGSPWPRPRARTLEDRQYVYQASSDVNGGTVTIGYPYALLEWCVEAHSSWSLPVDVRRVSSDQSAVAVGAVQSACCRRLEFFLGSAGHRRLRWEIRACWLFAPGPGSAKWDCGSSAL